MHFLIELMISILIVTGGAFVLIGSIGLVKLPDLMTRLHAPTKATTLGVGGALMASMLYFLAVRGALSVHEVLITLFLFLTAPITAHFIAKSHLHVHGGQNLPPAGRTCGWSTFDVAAQAGTNADAPPPPRSDDSTRDTDAGSMT